MKINEGNYSLACCGNHGIYMQILGIEEVE